MSHLAGLQALVLGFLEASPVSALFYAECLLSLDLDDETALYLRGLSLFRCGRYEDCVQALRAVIKTPSREVRPVCLVSLRCASLLLDACSQLNRPREALAVMGRVLKRSDVVDSAPLAVSPPNHRIKSLLGLGRAAQKTALVSQAAEAYTQVLELSPWCFEAVAGLCAMGRSVDLVALRRRLEDGSKGEKKGAGRSRARQDPATAQQSPSPPPSDASYALEVYMAYTRALSHLASFDCRRALSALKTLPIEQKRSSRFFLLTGRLYFELLEYEMACQAFDQARVLSPCNLEAMEIYSTVLWHLKLPTQLSDLAQDLMTLAPSSPVAWVASGNVFSHIEDHANALKCFKKAAQMDPSFAYAYTLAGHELVSLEQYSLALTFYRESLRRQPYNYQALFGLGNAFLNMGQLRMAEYHFRQAVVINKTNATLICCIGEVLEKQSNYDKALDVYNDAYRLAPKSPAVRFKRVRMMMVLGDHTSALSELLELKNVAPNEFNVYFYLGKVYKCLNQRAEAARYFGLAQDIEPRLAGLIREQLEGEGEGKD